MASALSSAARGARAARLAIKRHASEQSLRSAPFASGADNVIADGDGGDVCQSWPSEEHASFEHASFAFGQLASPGRTTIGSRQFISVLKQMQLDFNLSEHELRRVFDALDANNDGELSLDEFKSGRGTHPFARTLVGALSGSCSLFATDHFPDPNFDCGVSTAEFYSAPLGNGFHGDNKVIREALDYSYHNNYTTERQHFQDATIRSNVLLDGSRSERPWYVLTCGPMGAGKGWVLGWMSANGILQLERVSKIDPDAFKLRLPEWQLYQQQGLIAVAGTRTHAESAYVAEIAQHMALDNNMDVWVDGSLRNWQWYEVELQMIREKYPHYRIAIIQISAAEEMIERNIQRRASETGRDIPKDLRQATTADAIGSGVGKLVHLVDMVASVHNAPAEHGGDGHAISEPVLRYVSLVDRSGNWDLIRELTATHR